MTVLVRSVRYLKAVADHGSFTRAAAALHVSQPALSQQIRELEERMGVQLLDRSGRAVRPTDMGEAFLRHVRRAMDELEVGDRAMRDVKDLCPASHYLTFQAVPGCGCRPLPQASSGARFVPESAERTQAREPRPRSSCPRT